VVGDVSNEVALRSQCVCFIVLRVDLLISFISRMTEIEKEKENCESGGGGGSPRIARYLLQ
jgi:hypothetical protein